MDAFDVVRKLKARRNAILTEFLPDPFLAEVEEIDAAIRAIDRTIVTEGAGATPDIPDGLRAVVGAAVEPKGTRVPLSQRRDALRSFLASHGPATRPQIVAGTGIPAGSLSALLSEPEFCSIAAGLWGIRPPGTPIKDAPPDE